MRNYITILESLSKRIVYHGTSDLNWNEAISGTLYLTASIEDARNYADEAVVSNFYDVYDDYEEGMEMPSRPIIVQFDLDRLLKSGLTLEPDWGWAEQLDYTPTWQESLEAVGSFSIPNFSNKNMGKIIRIDK